ncbi:tyrosine-type recombinase/integrase [Neisseria subflava]|uniref:tyrosine-type recombinase/integrase n=1 Tax=Neisseria subflava TaxID=28449 RepID=UPI002029DC68|nr:tyrosine-type recombinase/integrase [Neisseria subflava]
MATCGCQSETSADALDYVVCNLFLRRLDEIARLRWSDFDETNRLWLVRDLKNPRGSKGNDKAFMVSDEAMAVINLMRSPEIARQMNVQNVDLLLGGYKGRSVGSLWQRACRELKIDDLRFHDLRHEGATRLAEKGLSIPVMQQFTLHGDWESMRRYTNLRARPPVLEMMEALQEADEIIRAEQPDRSFFA